MKYILILIFSLFTLFASGQNKKEKEVVQFTGAIVESDSLQPMPFVHITIKNSRMGTISDYYGFFSF